MLPPSLSEDQKIWLGRLYRRLKNVSDAIEDDLLINAPEMLFEYLSNNQCRKVLRASWIRLVILLLCTNVIQINM